MLKEVHSFYINAYNFFIILNQQVDLIMEELMIDLSFGQYTLLKFISIQRHQKITQKQLDDWSGLRKASISQLLKGLLQEEYVLHYAMNKDHRCKEIELTNKAIQCIEVIDLRLKDWLLNRMDEEEISFYSQAFDSVKEVISKEGVCK